MEPMSIIVGALVAGATAAGKGVASQVVKDLYAGLKGLVVRKFGSKTEVESALKLLEKKPDAGDRRETLRVELEEADAARDSEVLALARSLMDLLKEQGTGAQAVGKRGVIVGGDVKGNIVTGNGNVVGSSGRDRSNGEG